MKRDDTLWKAILEDIFDDFLLFFFKEDAAIFDFDKAFVFLDKELEQLFPPEADEAAHPKFVDKLVKVFTKTGGEEWVLVHIEVQGYSDAAFASRMFTYFYRILDKYKKPVTCVAIFTDGQKNYRPQQFNYSFLGTAANFTYNIYKVIEQDAAALTESNNPFAIVVLAVQAVLQKGGANTGNQLVGAMVGLVKALFQKQVPKHKIRAILRFLKYYVHFEDKEMRAKFDSEIDLITNKSTTMGIEQHLEQRFRNEGFKLGEQVGMEKGVYQEKLAITQKLLAFTDFSMEKIADMAGVSVAFVEEVKAALK